jgi:glycosyltransferase involved in cell wall biosynthesis
MNKPCVSVVIPVFNAENYLIEAVESILSQSLQDIEVILVDDKSTDGSCSVCEAFVRRDPRVQLVRRVQNGGISEALNDGLSVARGEFIARMDADDIAMPERLELQVAFLRKKMEVGLCGTAYEVIDHAGVAISRSVVVEDALTLQSMLKYCSPIAHPTWLMRASVLVSIGGYRNLAPSEDYDFLIRLIDSGWKIANIGYCGLKYRVSGSSTAARGALRQRKAVNYVRRLHFSGGVFDQKEFEKKIISSPIFYQRIHQISEGLLNRAVLMKNSGNMLFFVFVIAAILISPHQAQFVFRGLISRWIARSSRYKISSLTR